jgi:GNAT superfamily N-acetyltransferase
MQSTTINADEISIRQATEADAEALAALVGELGYPTEPATALERLRDSTAVGDCLLVAVHHSNVIGLILLHRTPFLHRAPDGRISTLVVSDNYRGKGVGGRLLVAAESVFREWGCTRIEVSSGAQRAAAHRFYLRAGYSEQPKRFIKVLA